MSKSYTPGLKILKNTVIRKERKLPLKGDINCSKGDAVKYNNVVASTFLPGNIHMVNVANQLNVEPDTISDYLTVSLNQEVDKGDIIAENKGLFGFFKSQVISPFKGKISNVSKRTGQIMVSEPEILTMLSLPRPSRRVKDLVLQEVLITIDLFQQIEVENQKHLIH